MKCNSDNGKLKLLIVDDDIEVLDIYKIILDTSRFNCTAVDNPNTAFRLYENNYNSNSEKFDAVISDLKMPELSGIDLLSKLKKIDREVRMILVTGWKNDENRKEAQKNNAYGFLEKPFKIDELISILEKIKIEMENKAKAYRKNIL